MSGATGSGGDGMTMVFLPDLVAFSLWCQADAEPWGGTCKRSGGSSGVAHGGTFSSLGVGMK